jgi:hypothetical protein
MSDVSKRCRPHDRIRVVIDAIVLMPAAAVSLWRGLRFYLSRRTGTPLRALCIAAQDFLHKTRYGTPLDADAINTLAAMIELGARLNQLHDGKMLRDGRETINMRRAVPLEPRGGKHDRTLYCYMKALKDLECNRPLPAARGMSTPAIIAYREDVIRLSLGTVSTIAEINSDIASGIQSTKDMGAMNVLFRIVMQCQILDDVLDQQKDTALKLPTFMTASSDSAAGFRLALQAVVGYSHRKRAATGELALLNFALMSVTVATKIVIVAARAVAYGRGLRTIA